MKRVKTLLQSVVDNPTYSKLLTVKLGAERLAEIATGTVRIAPSEAESIQVATSGNINGELLLQLNEDDLASAPQKRSDPKRTASTKSPAPGTVVPPKQSRDW